MTLDELVGTLGAHGVHLSVRGDDLVLSGRVERLSPSLVDRVRARKREILARHRVPGGPPGSYEASFGQARLAFTAALRPMSAAYNVAATLVLRGDALDLDALVDAVHAVMHRHKALRTHLEMRDGCVRAVVALDTPLAVDLIDLSTEDAAVIATEIAALRHAVATHGFDLTKPPLWRCHIVRTRQCEAQIVAAVHHFIADGWSLARALREVAGAYASLTLGRPPVFRSPAAEYSTYAAWQREAFESETGRAMLAWWRRSLAGFDVPIDFPSDRPRPAVLSDRGDRIAFALAPDVAQSVRRFAAARHTTVSAVVSAAHAVLLHRYSGTERFLVGIAVSNRPAAMFHDVFGFFVNWLPVRADFSGEPTFDQLFTRWEEARMAALRHQDTPFDAIARATGGDGDLSRHPVFQHMVVSHVPARGVRMGQLTASVEPMSTGTSKLDMTLFLTDTAGAVAIEGHGDVFLELEYSTDLFDRATVDAVGRSLVAVLSAATSAPNMAIADLPLVSPGDGGRLAITDGGAAATADPSPLVAFHRAALRHMGDTAIVHGETIVSYGDLAARAAAIAGALRGAEVGRGDRVALLLPRTPDLVASVLGGMLAGACVVPLDRTLPPKRVLEILDDADPACVVTLSTLDGAVRERLSGRRVVLADAVVARDGTIHWRRADDIAPSDLAYLLYTSGSTGRPKGVLGAHRPLANFVAWLNGYLDTGPGDRVLAKTPLGFDASLREILAPLCAGATLVLAGDGTHLDPQALAGLVASESVTILHGTPTMYREILAAGSSGRPALTSLRHVMCGGERLDAALADTHFRIVPGARLHNVYGPTECAVDVTAHEVRSGEREVPLGRAIAGAVVYVAGRDLAPLPAGPIGEIVIGGIPPGPGYWRRDAEERARFVVPSGGPCRGQRVFRTGDLGRLAATGDLCYCGRADRQVKMRGARVEPGEIERVMLQHTAVAAAAVAHIRDDAGGTLVAFAQLRDAGGAEAIEAVRAHLVAALPRYMVPSAIVAVPRLPKLASGKVDYAALAATWTPAAPAGASVPMTTNEARVAAVMSELLDRPIASADADFFQNGGHSLTAARLIGRLARDTGIVITLGELFERPTVAAIASVLDRKQHETASASPAFEAIAPAVRPRRHDA